MKTKLAWVLQILLAILFVLAGAAKFISPQWPRWFADWHYPAGSYAVVGLIEILAGIALLIPAAVRSATLLLIAIMMGAVVTLMLHPGGPGLKTPIIYLALLGVVVALRWTRPRLLVQ